MTELTLERQKVDRKLVELIFGNVELKEVDCATCPDRFRCMYEDTEGNIEFEVNGCSQ